MSADDQVEGLRDAAAVIEARAEFNRPIHDNGGVYIGVLTTALARPIARNLRAMAELIERNGSPLGLPVSYDLEIAGVVLGRDLGHNR